MSIYDIPTMKPLSLLLCLFAAFLPTSCRKEHEPAVAVAADAPMQISFLVAADRSIGAGSGYSVVGGTPDENYIDPARLRLFVFDRAGKFLFEITEPDSGLYLSAVSPDNRTSGVYRISAAVSEAYLEAFAAGVKIAVLANFPVDAPPVTLRAGEPLSALGDADRRRSVDMVRVVDGKPVGVMPEIGRFGIPMYGVGSFSGVELRRSEVVFLDGCVSLLRAVAKVEVKMPRTLPLPRAVYMRHALHTAWCTPRDVTVDTDVLWQGGSTVVVGGDGSPAVQYYEGVEQEMARLAENPAAGDLHIFNPRRGALAGDAVDYLPFSVVPAADTVTYRLYLPEMIADDSSGVEPYIELAFDDGDTGATADAVIRFAPYSDGEPTDGIIPVVRNCIYSYSVYDVAGRLFVQYTVCPWGERTADLPPFN